MSDKKAFPIDALNAIAKAINENTKDSKYPIDALNKIAKALDNTNKDFKYPADALAEIANDLTGGGGSAVELPSIKLDYHVVPVVQDPEDYSYSYAPGYQQLIFLGYNNAFSTSYKSVAFVTVNANPCRIYTKRLVPIYGTTNEVLFWFIPDNRDYNTKATTGYKITKSGNDYELEPMSIKYDVYNRSEKSFSGSYSIPNTELSLKLKLTVNPGTENETVYEPAYCLAENTFGDYSSFSRASDAPKISAPLMHPIRQSSWAPTDTPLMTVNSVEMGTTTITVPYGAYLGHVFIDGGGATLGRIDNVPVPETSTGSGDDENTGGVR